MIVRVGALGHQAQFVTALTGRPGIVLQKDRNLGPGVLVELSNPSEEKSLHEDVYVWLEPVH